MALLTTTVERLERGQAEGYLAGIVYMAPEKTVNGLNVCKFATNECKRDCLYTSGRGRFTNVQTARINRTVLFRDNPEVFYKQLTDEIDALVRKAAKQGLKPAIRLNGTSDIDHRNYIKWYNGVHRAGSVPIQFYDYTKRPDICLKQMDHKNYHLTYSHGGLDRVSVSLRHLQQGFNVTVVFAVKKGKPLPKTWNGYRVIDGDLHDLRFLDPMGVVVGLRARGDATKTVPVINGFVNPDLPT